MFFSRHPTNSKLLHSLVSHFMIPEAVIIEVNAKMFSPIYNNSKSIRLRYYLVSN